MNSLFTRIAVLIAFVAVSFGANAQSISSTLNNRPGVTVNVQESFTVTLNPGALSPLTNIKLAIVLATPSQSSNIALQLQNPQTLVYETLVFDGSGNSVSPAAPFFLFSPMNAKVTFAAPGVYNYTLQILNGTTNAVIASSVESVTVFAAPSISSTLNGQTLTTGVQTAYSVSTTPGAQAGTLVKVFFKMNATQVANASIEYFEISNSTWQPFPINPNGTAVFGPGTGFPFANATTQFRVTYNAPGVYNYKLSVFKAAAPNDTLAFTNESVTVVNPTPPTISSSIAGSTIVTGVQTPYSISTTTGGYAGTMIKVFFKMNPAQIAGGTTEYYEPSLSAWVPFTVNPNGEAIFGPGTGFPLANTASQFRVTYNTPGVYNYKMAIVKAAVPNDTLAFAYETVTVVNPTPPTISSNLNGQTVQTSALTNYAVTTVDNDYAGTMVRVFFKLANPAQVSDVNISYEATPGNFLPLSINASGIGYFGPASGFPLADASTNFQAIFDAAGVYGYKMSVYNVANNDTLATATESVTVVDYVAPTIESSLDGLTVFTGDETSYQVTTTAGSEAGTLVRGFFKLNNVSQTADVNVSYETAPGVYTALPLNPNGTVAFGPGTGFPLANAASNFKVTFDAAGTYDYKLYVYEVATNDTLATNIESVTVVDYIAPTIESSLDGLTVFTGDETLYQVTTTAGSEAGTLVRGFFKLNNVTQTADVNVSYETAPGVYTTLPLNPNGTVAFGPGTGFPLADAASNFKVTFDAAGTYDYKLYVYEVATNDTLATNVESVTVVDYIAPTIESSLDGMTVNVTAETPYQVTTTAGSEAGTFVKVFFELDNAAQTGDVNITYEATAGVFVPLTLNANGQADFGPVSGFPLADAATNFKVIFDAVGVYGYKMSLYDAVTFDTLATATESVTVVDPTPVVPEISSDLDGRAGVIINEEETFTVTTVKNNAPNANVRIKITLDTPSQGNFISLLFNNPATSSFEQLTFDANGVAYAGAPAGFALANEDYDFKVTFFEGGTYGYNLSLVNVAGGTTLANNDEEVVVIDNSSINENASFISNAFPNPTTGIVNIQTTENAAGTLGVYTITGKKMMTQNINGSLHTVSMETLTAGMYIIKISQNGKDAVIRIVKN